MITRHKRQEPEETPEAAKRAAARQDLVYRMKRWPRSQFDRELKMGGELERAVAERDEGTWHAMTRELFGRLYQVGTDRMEEPSEGAEWAEELHHQADAIPEWQDLAGHVQGDAWRAGIGAATAAQVLAATIPELPEEDVTCLQAEADFLAEAMEGEGGGQVNEQLMAQQGNVQRRLARAREAAAAAHQQLKDQGGTAIRSALRGAARAAKEAVEEVDDALDGLGWGTGPGSPTRRRVAQRLSNSDKLKKIAALAGRLRAQARARQKTKTDQERSEMHGIETGDDLHRLLASEVGLLPRADTRSLLLMRIADKRALQYKLRGKEPKSRGPIIFMIDTSGSMSGAREVWAKASALAMMEIARIQKRAFAVCFFGSSVVREDRFDPQKLSVEELLECLEFFSSGGTNIANAIDHGADLVTDPEWRPGRKADVVLVTDGVDGTDKGPPLAKLEEADAQLYTVCIDCECPADLVAGSEEVVRITARDMQGASTKLDPLFTI